jgi:hypothetical protein
MRWEKRRAVSSSFGVRIDYYHRAPAHGHDDKPSPSGIRNSWTSNQRALASSHEMPRGQDERMTTICVQYSIRTTCILCGHHDNHEANSIVGSSKRELDIPTVTVSSRSFLHRSKAITTWTGSLPPQTSSAKNETFVSVNGPVVLVSHSHHLSVSIRRISISNINIVATHDQPVDTCQSVNDLIPQWEMPFFDVESFSDGL